MADTQNTSKPSLEEIKAQIESLGSWDLLGVSEIKKLPNIIWPGERIEKVARGRGVLLATSKRLIFLETHWGDLDVQESLSYDKVSSVRYVHSDETSPPGAISISAEGGSLHMQKVGNEEALDFCNHVARKISRVEEHKSTQKETGNSSVGLISFFTIDSAELKVWSIPNGTNALKAAGKICSDMERGFIRAEVISHSDLMKCGNLTEARRKGLLRLEGKNYIVQDGDVITFLYNV